MVVLLVIILAQPGCAQCAVLLKERDDKLSLFSVQCVEDINNFLNREDPVKGQWTVPAGDTCKLLCDASSLAIGVVLFVDDVKVEDNFGSVQWMMGVILILLSWRRW